MDGMERKGSRNMGGQSQTPRARSSRNHYDADSSTGQHTQQQQQSRLARTGSQTTRLRSFPPSNPHGASQRSFERQASINTRVESLRGLPLQDPQEYRQSPYFEQGETSSVHSSSYMYDQDHDLDFDMQHQLLHPYFHQSEEQAIPDFSRLSLNDSQGHDHEAHGVSTDRYDPRRLEHLVEENEEEEEATVQKVPKKRGEKKSRQSRKKNHPIANPVDQDDGTSYWSSRGEALQMRILEVINVRRGIPYLEAYEILEHVLTPQYGEALLSPKTETADLALRTLFPKHTLLPRWMDRMNDGQREAFVDRMMEVSGFTRDSVRNYFLLSRLRPETAVTLYQADDNDFKMYTWYASLLRKIYYDTGAAEEEYSINDDDDDDNQTSWDWKLSAMERHQVIQTVMSTFGVEAQVAEGALDQNHIWPGFGKALLQSKPKNALKLLHFLRDKTFPTRSSNSK
ncbi:hypothetical protein CBS101457_003019 [Exobasidium rhododendri]|nr:hypothetical protein CBS101457_003019 [Exobasidium rhododendri]